MRRANRERWEVALALDMPSWSLSWAMVSLASWCWMGIVSGLQPMNYGQLHKLRFGVCIRSAVNIVNVLIMAHWNSNPQWLWPIAHVPWGAPHLCDPQEFLLNSSGCYLVTQVVSLRCLGSPTKRTRTWIYSSTKHFIFFNFNHWSTF